MAPPLLTTALNLLKGLEFIFEDLKFLTEKAVYAVPGN